MQGTKASEATKNEDLKISAGCAVCTEAILTGDITIGAGSVIHPRAQVIAESGPIVIGENNLIEENAQIINRHEGNKVMVIGNNNVFEVGSKCEALTVGDNNILEPKAVIGPKVLLTTGCTIGAMCEVVTEEILPDNTVIFGRNCQRRINAEKPPLQMAQLEFLRKVLPNFHYLHTAKKA